MLIAGDFEVEMMYSLLFLGWRGVLRVILMWKWCIVGYSEVEMMYLWLFWRGRYVLVVILIWT